MGGLGNGRRGVRSPPLMIGALVACILVLGFNYWISSSRNLDLQTKLYELEGQVRRGAAERGVAEMKKNEFQEEIQRQKEEIQRQKEQISHIESLYKRQMEGAQDICSQEKSTMQRNISSSTKTIQELKGQLTQLNLDLGKLQKELQVCLGNINTLNNKLTYDMTHCNSQVLSQKELCDERVAAAKREVQKKMEKLIPPQSISSQESTINKAIKEGEQTTNEADAVKTATVVSHTPGLSQPTGNEPAELLTNEIIESKEPNALVKLLPAKDQTKVKSLSVPSAATSKQDTLLPPEGAVKTQETKTSKPLTNNLTEENEMEVMDANEEGAQTEADPGMEGMLIGRGKVDESHLGLKLEDQEYDADEQEVGGLDLGKQQNKQAEKIDKDMEEELADYNGDEENEGEFEADKQAALAQN
ncbi:Golgi membrane protein 1 isoform X2 [Mastacembelus armatus]|uniref:Golgi membrane protein 1 isoform X2 n=1 Tax=Mastacembelus armatus TaxID=205130 RepID=UPI000E459425|nr:Golgi membrane protein 1 isoform X2 [Mastacembelus armatus]